MRNSTSHRNVELLNLIMLLLATVVSCVLPFDTFLFSYAVLGPLHYLTELQWLKKKDYFLPQKKVRLFVFLSVALAFFLFLNYISIFNFYTWNNGVFIGILLCVFFIISLYFILTVKSIALKSMMIGLLISCVALYYFKPGIIIFFGLFIPTIIHVYVFTAVFMISGYLLNPNRLSLLSIVLLLVMPFLIYFLPVETLALEISQAKNIFNLTGFKLINQWLVFLTGKTETEILIIKVQIFIAFAYTYHYLNWFSKTSVIGWARSLEPKKMVLVAAIWILSIALYLINYQTGLMLFFVLSMIHVLAEFPLNAISFRTVFQKLFSK
ncbi:hypothetical protein SAMN05421857_2310 [Chryseobacterium formosense]|nr:hypothetical protein [Chryseobacterium formosense]SFT63444.1 hypothetical protein SAMN05421857_2310 [Chryseobacterium formosense]